MIEVCWDNLEQTIVRWDFVGDWDWKMFQEAQQQSDKLLQSVEHRVDIIGDVRNSPVLPKNAFGNYNKFQRNTLDNKGWIILVGANPFVKSMVTIFDKLHRVSGLGFAFADTPEEARAMLASGTK